jgi:hypothetical protein
VYIAMPVIDRVEFVQDYWQQPAPTFVMQSVLASAVTHAPLEILNAAGFSDCASAQEAFFTRAKLLHDFDIEKRMLQRLQGSLILSVSHVSHYMQCDHRYWFSNATCIAARMGLHRIIRHEGADSSTKILRRIWWLMYTWDVLLSLNGMNTMRRFHDADSDVPHLVEDDWEDERLPDGQTMLLPIARLEKLYLIQNCKLSLLSEDNPIRSYGISTNLFLQQQSADSGSRCSTPKPSCPAMTWKSPFAPGASPLLPWSRPAAMPDPAPSLRGT